MLACVTIGMLTGSVGKKTVQEEGDSHLSPSSTTLLERSLPCYLLCVFWCGLRNCDMLYLCIVYVVLAFR